MSKLRLSRQATEGFTVLKTLTTTQVEQLVDELNSKLRVSLQIDASVERIVERVLGALDPDAQEQITRTVIGIQFLRLTRRDDDKEFSRQLAQHLEPATDTELQRLTEIILQILSVPPLRASAKAWSLVDEFERIYMASRIMTDIRPIFAENIKSPLGASLLMHSMRITTRINGENESTYIIMDEKDLFELKDQIERALEKSTALRQVLGNVSMGEILGARDDN